MSRTRWRIDGARRRAILVQLFLFVLLAINLELFCGTRLRVEGFETDGGVAEHDAVLGWRIKAAGSRYDPPAPQRGEGELRVLCLGTSVTYGVGVLREESYPVRLQALLARELPGRTVRVFNAGLPGAASHQAAELLVELFDATRPDIVVLMLGHNEMFAEPFRQRPDFVGLRSLLYKSATYRYLLRRLRSDDVPSTRTADQVLQATADNVRFIVDRATAGGAHVLLCSEAFDVAALRRELRDAPPGDTEWWEDFVSRVEAALSSAARRGDIPYLDMSAVLVKGRADIDSLFLDKCHYTRAGCEAAASAIADELRALGWLRN